MAQFFSADGQVTIPAEIRERLGLKPGDAVEFAVNDNGEVTFNKSEAVATEAVFSWARGIAGPGLSTNEIMAMTRGED
jgi:AbrB family looped-hinge helix DNA binding protein